MTGFTIADGLVIAVVATVAYALAEWMHRRG